VTVDELKAAPIEVVLEHFIEVNSEVTPSIAAAWLLSALDTLGWKIIRR
jgi:hypothetical protein